MTDRKILILGAGGQLGSDLMDVYGDRAIGADLPEVNISEPEALWRALGDIQPEVVVNAAAYTAVDRAEEEPEIAMDVNGRAPAYLAEWAAQHNAYLVHLSTDYVFDGCKPAGQAYTEKDQPSPMTAYGRSKRSGETAVLESTAKAVIVRTAWMYGHRGGNFLKSILRRAIHKPEEQLRIVNDQWGCPTWSHRLAEQIAAIIEQRVTGIVHAVSKGATTWYEFGQYFFECMGLKVEISPCSTAEYPTPAKRPANSALKNDRLGRTGICIMRPWRDDLMEFIEQYREALMREARERSV